MSELLNLAENHVKLIFDDSGWRPFSFHSIHHTFSVYEKAKEWAHECDLNSEDSTALQLAALFHDVGYLTKYDSHEAEGIRIFLVFAKKNGISSGVQKNVSKLIGFTRKRHSDFSDPLARIIHDIDRAAMGMPNFIDQGFELRKEWEHFKGLETNNQEWFEFQVQYLEKTNFKTEYGLLKYNTQREENLLSLRARLTKLKS